MTRAPADAAVWLVASAATAAVTAVSFLQPPVGAGTEAVDVLVVNASEVVPALPGGPAPRGVVEAAEVDAQTFRFAGWAELAGDAFFVLETTAAQAAPRLRTRSVPRQDVVDALDDPDLLFSGYVFSGLVSEWGAPTCLYLVMGSGARTLWESAAGRCGVNRPVATAPPSVAPIR